MSQDNSFQQIVTGGEPQRKPRRPKGGSLLFHAMASAQGLRETIPDRFFCPSCMYITEPYSQDWRDWVAANRPELASSSFGVKCQCADKGEAFQQRQRGIAKDSNLPSRAGDKIGPRTFDNFNLVLGSDEMAFASKAFAEGRGSKVLVLVGVQGCGKTHLLEAVGRFCESQAVSVRYEETEPLLNRLRHSYSDEDGLDMHELVEWYQSFGVLILDDIGLTKASDWGKGYITQMVNTRYQNGLPLIVATTLAKDELAEEWGDALASRLFDRSGENVKVVFSEAGSYRDMTPAQAAAKKGERGEH